MSEALNERFRLNYIQSNTTDTKTDLDMTFENPTAIEVAAKLQIFLNAVGYDDIRVTIVKK